jgi:hypothetical protein
MATIHIADAILEQLKIMAAETTYIDEVIAGEDVVVDDYAGGNVDDAYYKGCQDGRVELARDILGRIKEW